MNRALLSEFIGTFFLSLIVVLSVSGSYPIQTPILAGLVLMLFVYTIGNISGCHINPGVTLGLLSLKKISVQNAAKYIAVQLFGAALALGVSGIGKTVIPAQPPMFLEAYIFEMLGMVLFTFGIGTIVFDDKKSLVSGVVIGGSLFMGISLAVMGGGAGILNPAVALAFQTTDPWYYIIEILGGVIGFQLASYLTHISRAKK